MSAVANAWQKVEADAARLRSVHLRDLFENDASRFDEFSRRLDDLLVDFSKEKIDAASFQNLLNLAKVTDVVKKRDAMFAGDVVNCTEKRPALHIAARDPNTVYNAPGAEEVVPTKRRFLAFAEGVRNGEIAAADGGAFSDVISIGIGGSDLGPVMATRALAPYADGPKLHYVSNVDGAHFGDIAKPLDPRRTLVIIQSKTFTTLETMTNAKTAKAWLANALGAQAATTHLAAVSTNLEGTAAFGVPKERVFGFWNWIGGRYSLWSAIGLPVAIAIGAKAFAEFLSGAHDLDVHFRTAPPEQNLPILLGLIGVWRRNAMGASSVAVIPYDERLARFPAYLQQLMMESNGKSVTRDGGDVVRATCPIVWGEPGTNAQHSFFQLLQQGTDIVPVDFILAAEAHEADDNAEHHTQLIGNCLAQSQALGFGRPAALVRQEMQQLGHDSEEIERLVAHRTFDGDRPSTTILYRKLTPYTLGRLVALYEHRTFVEAAIWDINPFDQWGVELGKDLAKSLLSVFEGADDSALDASTRGLILAVKAAR